MILVTLLVILHVDIIYTSVEFVFVSEFFMHVFLYINVLENGDNNTTNDAILLHYQIVNELWGQTWKTSFNDMQIWC